MNRAARTVILFIAQGAYAGRSPVAPGTSGTVVGVFLYLGMKNLPPGQYLAVCVLVILAGNGPLAAQRSSWAERTAPRS